MGFLGFLLEVAFGVTVEVASATAAGAQRVGQVLSAAQTLVENFNTKDGKW